MTDRPVVGAPTTAATEPPIHGSGSAHHARMTTDRRYGRSPSDLLRLVIAVAAAGVGFLLASGLDNLSVALTVETIDVFEWLPDEVVVAFILLVQLSAWLVPVGVGLTLLVQRRFRRLGLVAFAATLAATVAWAIGTELVSRFQPPELAIEAPNWICAPEDRGAGLPELSSVGAATETPASLFTSAACVPGDAFPGTTYIAAFSGATSVLAPWMSGRWKRAAWISLLLFLLVRTLDGVVVAVDGVLVIAIGVAIGAGTDLLFGSPLRHPGEREIIDALLRRGIHAERVQPAAVRARSSNPFTAETRDGRLFLKVLGPDERAADVLYRLYRIVRFRGFGDERPSASLRGAVEHEAVGSMSASNGGVRTPQLRAITDVGTASMLLAFDMVEGQSLADIDPELITDRVLTGTWRQVGLLRSRRIAHRNLGPSNLLIDTAGDVHVVDFGFADISATEGELRNDVAEALVALSLLVGAERAVGTAVATLGRDAVADAAPRLQIHALSSSTRESLKDNKELLKRIRDMVTAVCGLEKIEYEALQRVKPSALVGIGMLGLAFYVLIPQITQVELSAIADADWRFIPVIAFFSLATYAAAALSLMGAVPDRLRFVDTLSAQVASSFFNRVLPAKVGGMAANVRYLQRTGVEPAIAVASIAVNNAAGVLVHVALTVIFITAAGRSASGPIALPSAQSVLLVVLGLLALGGLVLVPTWARRVFFVRLWPILKKAGSGVTAVMERPSRVAMLFGGSAMISTFYIFCLWYSLEAFGGGPEFTSVAAVFLAGSAVAQVAPTPGGVGAAEAALIAGLTAFGVDASIAVPAVFLYRLVTFWLPIVPGWAAYRYLAARGAL